MVVWRSFFGGVASLCVLEPLLYFGFVRDRIRLRFGDDEGDFKGHELGYELHRAHSYLDKTQKSDFRVVAPFSGIVEVDRETRLRDILSSEKAVYQTTRGEVLHFVDGKLVR